MDIWGIVLKILSTCWEEVLKKFGLLARKLCIWMHGGGGALVVSIEIWILFVTSLYSLVGLTWDVLLIPKIWNHIFLLLPYTGWGKCRFIVVHIEKNTIINK